MPNAPTNIEEQRRKARERKNQRYHERAAKELCRRCGGALKPPAATDCLCGRCLRLLRNEYRRRDARRRAESGRLRHEREPPPPNAAKLQNPIRVTVAADRWLLTAIEVLRSERRAQTPGEIHALSRLLRETIRARFADPLQRLSPRECDGVRIPEVQFCVVLDAETLAIVTRHAARTFDNNRAKTIRALIEAAARDIILRNPAAYLDHPLCRVTRGTPNKRG